MPPTAIRRAGSQRLKQLLEGGRMTQRRDRRGPGRAGHGDAGVEVPERAGGGPGRAGTPRRCAAAERSSSAGTAAARPTPSTSPPSTWCAIARTRRPLAAVALTTDTSILTAAGNDLGFEQIFARQVEALCGPADLLDPAQHQRARVPTCSLRPGRPARARVPTVAFLGKGGGALAGWWTRPWWSLRTRPARSS